jgi:hypothetical protein
LLLAKRSFRAHPVSLGLSQSVHGLAYRPIGISLASAFVCLSLKNWQISLLSLSVGLSILIADTVNLEKEFSEQPFLQVYRAKILAKSVGNWKSLVERFVVATVGYFRLQMKQS